MEKVEAVVEARLEHRQRPASRKPLRIAGFESLFVHWEIELSESSASGLAWRETLGIVAVVVVAAVVVVVVVGGSVGWREVVLQMD